jgi:hypothetical protein
MATRELEAAAVFAGAAGAALYQKTGQVGLEDGGIPLRPKVDYGLSAVDVQISGASEGQLRPRNGPVFLIHNFQGVSAPLLISTLCFRATVDINFSFVDINSLFPRHC